MGYRKDKQDLVAVLSKLNSGSYTKTDPLQQEEARFLLSLQDAKRHVELQGATLGVIFGFLSFKHFRLIESLPFRLAALVISKEAMLYMHMPHFTQALGYLAPISTDHLNPNQN